MTRLKLSHIPEDGALAEKGLKPSREALGLGEPWIESSLELAYEFRKIHGKILGNFEASGRLKLECSRCLEPFDDKVSTKFLLEFEEVPEDLNPRSGVDPEDPELNVVFFQGDAIEFGDELRQEMELLVPFAPLCKKNCRGLCPVCGGNRNEKECGCEESPKNNPFTGLNKLFQQNKEN